jgi:tRNA-Thr(GGU) m(6)t(6)A37 methyltransferase TsaA
VGPASSPLTLAAEFGLREAGSTQSASSGQRSKNKASAPDAWIELTPRVLEALEGIETGDELIVITWLHVARRDVLKTHPRGDTSVPLTGVFATRSPDRPNPLGLHPVTVLDIAGRELKVGPLEAIDGTPVVDIKPVLRAAPDW